MALIPENDTELLDLIVEDTKTTEAPVVKTYALNFETGTVGSFIDGNGAIKQFVSKTLMTERSKYLVYTDDYGSELRDLIGQDITLSLMDAEIPRMVYEALIYDERISEVTNIEFSRDCDSLYINVTVIPSEGGEEVTTEVIL